MNAQLLPGWTDDEPTEPYSTLPVSILDLRRPARARQRFSLNVDGAWYEITLPGWDKTWIAFDKPQPGEVDFATAMARLVFEV